MASNFDFLKQIDKELYSLVQDGEKLFRDEYFNQSIVQFRIYAEKMAKSILNVDSSEMTFDTVLNNLKDKIKSKREEEFIEDLFFIKKQGNACAHGEDATAMTALEVIKRAFEAGINYVYSKKKDENIDKLIFDETLLITQKKAKEEKLIDKYLKAAQTATEELSKESILNQKQGEFLASVDKSVDENNLKDKNYIKDSLQYKQKPKKGRKKKELTKEQIETKQRIKDKVKKAKKNLKENVNFSEKKKKTTKKSSKKASKTKKDSKKEIIFVLFTIFAIYFLSKMVFGW